MDDVPSGAQPAVSIDLTHRAGAARYFLVQLIAAACDGTLRSTQRVLGEGAARASWPKETVPLHGWFKGLDPEDRAMALELVRHAARFSIFELLMLLDGMTGQGFGKASLSSLPCTLISMPRKRMAGAVRRRFPCASIPSSGQVRDCMISTTT